MTKTVVTLAPLTDADREQFIKDNQEAFNYGALEEFGKRDAKAHSDWKMQFAERLSLYK